MGTALHEKSVEKVAFMARARLFTQNFILVSFVWACQYNHQFARIFSCVLRWKRSRVQMGATGDAFRGNSFRLLY